jgi:hypothetical protein
VFGVVVVVGGGADVAVGIVGGLVLVVHRLCPRTCRRRHRRFRWVGGVQPRLGVLARTGEAPSCQVMLGVAWRGVGGGQQVGTSIVHAKLRGSSFAGNHIGRSGQWARLGRGGGDFQP